MKLSIAKSKWGHYDLLLGHDTLSSKMHWLSKLDGPRPYSAKDIIRTQFVYVYIAIKYDNDAAMTYIFHSQHIFPPRFIRWPSLMVIDLTVCKIQSRNNLSMYNHKISEVGHSHSDLYLVCTPPPQKESNEQV